MWDSTVCNKVYDTSCFRIFHSNGPSLLHHQLEWALLQFHWETLFACLYKMGKNYTMMRKCVFLEINVVCETQKRATKSVIPCALETSNCMVPAWSVLDLPWILGYMSLWDEEKYHTSIPEMWAVQVWKNGQHSTQPRQRTNLHWKCFVEIANISA